MLAAVQLLQTKEAETSEAALHGVSQLVLVLYSAAHSQAAAGLQTSSADRWPTLVAPASYRREVKLITSADRNDATLIW